MEEVAGAAQGVVEEGAQGGGGIFSFCFDFFSSVTSCVLSLCCCVLLPIVIAIVLIWNFLFRATGEAVSPILDDFSNVLGNLTDTQWPDVLVQEPTVGNPGDLNQWRTQPGVQGLQLELYNALDESWTDIFQESANDWDESQVLSLDFVDVGVDRECTFVDGVMKVCNANYGDTGWVGINEVELLDGYITASIAKMNEYYLRNADYAQRRYTMCHELGHGFGLTHTDEDPFNADLGNCLDYTDSPGNNLNPGETNFERLRQLYGNAEPQQGSNSGNVVSSSLQANEESETKNGGERRSLRRVLKAPQFVPHSSSK